VADILRNSRKIKVLIGQERRGDCRP